MLLTDTIFQDGFDLSVKEIHFTRTTCALIQINGEGLADNIQKVHIGKERVGFLRIHRVVVVYQG